MRTLDADADVDRDDDDGEEDEEVPFLRLLLELVLSAINFSRVAVHHISNGHEARRKDGRREKSVMSACGSMPKLLEKQQQPPLPRSSLIPKRPLAE